MISTQVGGALVRLASPNVFIAGWSRSGTTSLRAGLAKSVPGHLVVGAEDGRLYYLANNGSATTPLFMPREVAIEPLLDATGGEDGFSAPVFGDVDGDGAPQRLCGTNA